MMSNNGLYIRAWIIFVVLHLFLVSDISAMISTATKGVPAARRGLRSSFVPAAQKLQVTRAFTTGQDVPVDAVPDDRQRYNFLNKRYGQNIDETVDLLKINRLFTIAPLSYGQLQQIMDRAKEKSAQAGKEKMSIRDIYNAEMDCTIGPKKSREIVLANNQGVLIVPLQKRTAVHEAGHALVDLYSSSRTCINPLISIEPRKGVGGVVYAVDAYKSKNYMTHACVMDFMMMKMAGRVAEQVMGIETSSQKLINTQEIFDFLSAYHASNDMHEMEDLLQGMQAQNNFSKQQIQDLIVQAYTQTYQFLTEHKAELLKLSDDLLEKGTIYADEIPVGPSRHLYDFESGPLRKEDQLHAAAYRMQTPKRTYGYDDQGNYVGEDGTRDQSGNLEELD